MDGVKDRLPQDLQFWRMEGQEGQEEEGKKRL